MATISTLSSRNLFSLALFNWDGFSGHECFSRMCWSLSSTSETLQGLRALLNGTKVLGGTVRGEARVLLFHFPIQIYPDSLRIKAVTFQAQVRFWASYSTAPVGWTVFNLMLLWSCKFEYSLWSFSYHMCFVPLHSTTILTGTLLFLKASLDNLSVTCVKMLFEKSQPRSKVKYLGGKRWALTHKLQYVTDKKWACSA